MLNKKFYKTKCKVTFEVAVEELPTDVEIQSLHVVGEFNNWDKTTKPLHLVKNIWKETVDLELDKEYQYRLLINGTRWFNDPKADRYVPNNVDGDNCIVSTHPVGK